MKIIKHTSCAMEVTTTVPLSRAVATAKAPGLGGHQIDVQKNVEIKW